MKKNRIEELEKLLQQKEKEIFSIQRIGQALSNTLNLNDLLFSIMNEITHLMDADRSTLFLVDPEKQEIWSLIALKAEIREIRQKLGVGISGYVAASGETINIPDAYRDPRFDPTTDTKTGYRTRSILCVPVWEPLSEEENREIIGVIQVLNKKTGEFTREDETILKAISSQVAIAISNARLYQQLEKKYEEIDLLYEFEQLLSSQYEISELFNEMLKRVVEHLNGKQAVMVYRLENNFHLLVVDRTGQVNRLTVPGGNPELEQLIASEGKIASGELCRRLQQQFPELEDLDWQQCHFSSVWGEKEKAPVGLILFQPQYTRSITRPVDDRQMLNILSQKVGRGLQLHSLRESLLKRERLSAIGEMMSTIVHDLRSPLNNIYGFLELILDDRTTPEERNEYADIIRLEIQTIANMTREVLDFAKGKSNILPRKVSVKEILQRFELEARQLFRNSNIRFSMENQARKLLFADLEKFTRVLYNIAKNAKEAMGKEGQFTLKAYDEDGKVVFELADTGPGIPEEIRHRLFESFVTSGKATGTGLGLAIVKKIVEEHKGEIELKTKVGKGTTFFIKLPEYRKDTSLTQEER